MTDLHAKEKERKGERIEGEETLSKRPERIKAGSIFSTIFVAAMIITPEFSSKPSNSVKS